jgi:hypothetical protein
MIVELDFEGETYLREINEEDVLKLAKINDFKQRLEMFWKDSWPYPANPTETSDTYLDWQSDESWLDLFEFADYVLDRDA